MKKDTKKAAPAARYWLDRSPYWITKEGVAKIEELKHATYMGHWCIKTEHGWSERPVDVFYVAKPDKKKGHKHYFGILLRDGQTFICDATSAFSEPMTGVLAADGEVLVSRYRHDCQMKNGIMVDGGRDYLRSSASVNLMTVTVNNAEFSFTPQGTSG